MPKKRQIHLEKCTKCDGCGVIEVISSRKCKNCEGRGWASNFADVKVCSFCRGDGKVDLVSQKPCLECEGRGSFPRVVEVHKGKRETCPECQGNGYEEYWLCGYCEASTRLPKSRIGNSPVKPYTDFDETVRCGLCDRACGLIRSDCGNCNGRGTIVILTLRDIKSMKCFEITNRLPVLPNSEANESD